MKTILFFLIVIVGCGLTSSTLIKQQIFPSVKSEKTKLNVVDTSSSSLSIEQGRKYYPAFTVIAKKYHTVKNEHYELFPIILYPFFCIPKDTVRKFYSPYYRLLYLNHCTVVLKNYSGFTEHIIVAEVHYANDRKLPWTITYTLYFMYLNPANEWKESRHPISVVTFLKNSITKRYAPK